MCLFVYIYIYKFSWLVSWQVGQSVGQSASQLAIIVDIGISRCLCMHIYIFIHLLMCVLAKWISRLGQKQMLPWFTKIVIP